MKSLNLSDISTRLAALAPGLFLCAVIALAAQFISEHYGAPAILMALLLGLAIHPLAEKTSKANPGVQFCSKSILKLAVALIGARISFEIYRELGINVFLMVLLAMLSTIAISFLLAKVLGRKWQLAMLTGGAVSICGASAALAIAAVLPKDKNSDRNLSFTIFGVTFLSTIAMVVYPILIDYLQMSDENAGIFIGATIHDVAQVVGAGFSISDAAGETATTVKLLRVTLLAPIVICLSLTMGFLNNSQTEETSSERPPILPAFVIGFGVLVFANTMGWIPLSAQELANSISRAAMVMAIAAVGAKTELSKLIKVPKQAIIMLCLQTGFIAAFVLAGLQFI